MEITIERIFEYFYRWYQIKIHNRDITYKHLKQINTRHGAIGSVIGGDVILGDNVIISNNVTIGSKRIGETPILGNNVRVFSGAIIVGRVKIGNDVIIGAGSFIDKDIPSDSIVYNRKELVIKDRCGVWY